MSNQALLILNEFSFHVTRDVFSAPTVYTPCTISVFGNVMVMVIWITPSKSTVSLAQHATVHISMAAQKSL